MLEIKNISAGYGQNTVLQNVSLAVRPGEVLTVIGPNGSGKSTLLKACAHILPTEAGEILLEEVPFTSLSRHEIARQVSYLAQGKDVPDMTVGQMVLHGRFPHLQYRLFR